MKRTGLFLVVLLISALGARADELHLKDGTKIIGTIVGYQGSSFRVKTSYGFALVLRSSVSSITVTNPAAPAAPKETAPESAKPEAKNVKADEAGESSRAEEAKTASTEQKINEAAAKPIPAPRPATQVAAASAPAKTDAPKPAASSPPVTTPPAASTPAAAPAPEPVPTVMPVREEVVGNLYINETYGFEIYKPPDWNVIEGARAALPGAVVALGTSDQTTYLIIGLEPPGGALESHVASTNDRMAGLFDGYRPSAARRTLIAGLPAYEYSFHGTANGQEWTGIVALIARGETVFTIFGVASANTDLVQIQQNVISRTINSLQFTKR